MPKVKKTPNWEVKIILKDGTIITVRVEELEDVFDFVWEAGYQLSDISDLFYTNLNR